MDAFGNELLAPSAETLGTLAAVREFQEWREQQMPG